VIINVIVILLILLIIIRNLLEFVDNFKLNINFENSGYRIYYVLVLILFLIFLWIVFTTIKEIKESYNKKLA